MSNNKYKLSASLICADPLDLRTAINNLEEAKMDFIHFDVMDGNFVPRLGIYPEVLEVIRTESSLPIDVHLMLQNPELFIPLFIKNGANIITIPVEGNLHLHRTIKMIKDLGAKVGVALNPATPLNVLDYIIEDIDLVMIMAINPGIVGHKLIPQIINKIIDLKKKTADYLELIIEIDGGVTFESAPQMVNAGANMLICGSSTIFKKNESVKENIDKLRRILN